VKLLLDQNLSPRLARDLAALYPRSMHVRDVNLQAADDDTVWAYAATHGFSIVSKDADFHQRSFVLGHPPKVVWIRRGNCSTAEIEEILRVRQADVLAFEGDEQGAFLSLG
jgi:predicted nuclease of predicted toxin-antitoxin system